MRSLPALPILLLAAACSGGGNSGTAMPPAPARSAGAAATTAKFTLTVPAAGTAQSAARAPQYVSSSTQSVVITLASVNGATYSGSPSEIATNLTPSNPACTSASGNLVCTIVAPAVAGSDTFTVVAYDAQQTGPAPATPAGRILSQASLVIAVTAAQANQATTPLVLNGVAASFVTMFPSDPHVRGTQSAGYQIAGNWSYTFSVVPEDADGNIIVGPGTPALTVTSASSAIAIAPVNGSANTYTLQAQHYSAAPVAIAITPASGSAGSISIATVPELWVTEYSLDAVATYALWPGTSPALLPDTVSTGPASGPYGIGFDGNGNLWVSERQGAQMSEFAAGSLAPVNVITGVGQPIQFAFDSAGNLWNADNTFGDNEVIEHSPPYSNTPSGTIATGTLPFGLAVDAHGNVWTTTNVPSAITEYVAPTYTAGVAIADGNTPYGLAFDASGDLWVADNGNSTVVEHTPPFTGGPATTVSATSGALGLGFDPAGNLWVANGANTIAEYVAPTFTAGSTISNANQPSFVAFTP